MAFRGGNASREECLNFAQMYRAHIAPAESVMPFDGGGRKGRGGGAGAGRVLCFWCFCPGVAMEDLRALGVSPFLLLSGNAFESRCGLEGEMYYFAWDSY